VVQSSLAQLALFPFPSDWELLYTDLLGRKQMPHTLWLYVGLAHQTGIYLFSSFMFLIKKLQFF
jgi:hypothetical protein